MVVGCSKQQNTKSVDGNYRHVLDTRPEEGSFRSTQGTAGSTVTFPHDKGGYRTERKSNYTSRLGGQRKKGCPVTQQKQKALTS